MYIAIVLQGLYHVTSHTEVQTRVTGLTSSIIPIDIPIHVTWWYIPIYKPQRHPQLVSTAAPGPLVPGFCLPQRRTHRISAVLQARCGSSMPLSSHCSCYSWGYHVLLLYVVYYQSYVSDIILHHMIIKLSFHFLYGVYSVKHVMISLIIRAITLALLDGKILSARWYPSIISWFLIRIINIS